MIGATVCSDGSLETQAITAEMTAEATKNTSRLSASLVTVTFISPPYLNKLRID
jgi:hypothetical protein